MGVGVGAGVGVYMSVGGWGWGGDGGRWGAYGWAETLGCSEHRWVRREGEGRERSGGMWEDTIGLGGRLVRLDIQYASGIATLVEDGA